jgi:hypothetical protein
MNIASNSYMRPATGLASPFPFGKTGKSPVQVSFQGNSGVKPQQSKVVNTNRKLDIQA